MKKKAKGAGRKPAPVGNRQVNVRFPPAIAEALATDAGNEPSRTVQAVVIAIIAEHYGIEVAAPQRGRPSKVQE